jgi:hypothetical protein
MDHPAFPSDLKESIRKFCFDELLGERSANDTDEQFVYKARKRAWGPLKQDVWNLDADAKARIYASLEEKFEFLYDQLGVTNTRHLVDEHIQPVKIEKPKPAVLGA